MKIDVILGLQWGDEGKGKIVDYLADSYDIVARFQGGPNAGHTLKFDGQKHVLHTVPSGIFRSKLINIIGNGVVIDPITLEKEIENLKATEVSFLDRLFVSRKAHLILPTHRYLDAATEAFKGKEKIGSTLKGIGPTYMDKTGRNGLRVGDIMLPNFKERYEALKEKHMGILKIYPDIDFDLKAEEDRWFASLKTLRSLKQINCEYFINNALKEGKKVLAEGAQGSMLDIDFGTYPFVTSSNTITAGVCNGLGVILLNGVTQLVVTKIDILNKFEEISVATHYRYDGELHTELPYDLCHVPVEPVHQAFTGWQKELSTSNEYADLPENAKALLGAIEARLNVPITMISTGPERDALILRGAKVVTG